MKVLRLLLIILYISVMFSCSKEENLTIQVTNELDMNRGYETLQDFKTKQILTFLLVDNNGEFRLWK